MDTTTLNPETKTPRAVDALYDYALEQVKYRARNPVSNSDRKTLQLKNDFYKDIFRRYRNSRNPDDKSVLEYIRFQISRMNEKLNPSFLNRVILIVSAIKYFMELFIFRKAPTAKNLKQFEKQHERALNLNAIQTAIRKTGFSESLEGPLQKMMQHDLDRFHLRHSEPRYLDVEFVLYFEKIPGTHQYQFQKFEIASGTELTSTSKKNSSPLWQQFGTTDKISFSAGEATKLIQNRPIAKMIDGVERWIVPDHPDPKILLRSFDLSREIGGFQIKEASTAAGLKQLTDTLKKGDQKEVTVLLPDGPEKYKLSMSRFGDSLNFHDRQGKLVDIERLIRPDTGSLKARAQKLALETKQTPVIHIGGRHRI